MSAPAHNEGRIVVVGAGPHALTSCSYLLAARPGWHSRLLVIDPEGWLTRWDTRMARLEIDVLRSPGVHHPDPAPYALFDFAIDRPDQLRGELKSPTVGLFADFCADLIARHRLHEVLEVGTVKAIVPHGPGNNAVELENGARYDAATVVIAANRTTPRLPDWAATSAGGAVTHAEQVDPSGVGPGERVVVIGGGLTAAQLCVAAMRRGAEVTLVARHRLRCSGTDVEPGWLSRHLLGPYLAEPDWERRAGIYRAARRGTMPACWADIVHRAASEGHLVLHESAAVNAMTAGGEGHTLSTTAGPIDADRVWLATGWNLDTRTDPLMAPLLHAGTTTCGLPLLDDGCALPGTTVHLSGAAAALQTGAFAPNLAGARIAAERIVATLSDLVERQYPVPSTGIPSAAERLSVSEPAHPDGDAESPTRLARALDAQPGCTVVVCGGLACAALHDQMENLRQLGRVIARSTGGVLIRSLGCLGPCGHAPVVIVTGRPALHAGRERTQTDGRRLPGTTVWTTLTEPGQLDRLKAWIEAGGPGVAPLPEELDPAVIAIR